MEELNRNSYEIWFLDYIDGQLNNDQQAILMDFLAQNPDLKEELDGIAGISLTHPDVTFESKHLLTKTEEDIPGIASDDRLCIARMESDMTGEQAAGFDRRLDTEPILRQQFSDFLKTRLVVPDQVVYPDKSELKRKIRLLTPWMITAISAAAVLVLALLLWPGPPTNTIPELAATGSGISIPATDVAKDNNPPAVQAPVEELPGQTRIAGLKTTVKSSGEPALANQQSPRDSVSPTALRPRVLQGPRIPEPNTTRTLYASNQIKPADISLPAEEVLTLPQYAFRLFREKILGQDPDLVRKTRFSLWEVAGAGVNGINSLAGTNMKLDRTYDPSADRMTLSFNSRLFDVETPVQGQVAR